MVTELEAKIQDALRILGKPLKLHDWSEEAIVNPINQHPLSYYQSFQIGFDTDDGLKLVEFDPELDAAGIAKAIELAGL